MSDFRTQLDADQRSLDLQLTIDPGFVHHRKIAAILGQKGLAIIDSLTQRIPSDLPEGLRAVRIDNIYAHVFVDWCGIVGIRTLEELIASRQGYLFCSVEALAACPEIYDRDRVAVKWVPRGEPRMEVVFEFSTALVTSDTLRGRLYSGGVFAIVAELADATEERATFAPIVIGFPWLENPRQEPARFAIEWFSYDYFENFVEDIDEFARLRDVPIPPNPEPMRNISERAFKQSIAKIFGDAAPVDWGGEHSDFFSAHVHLAGHPTTAAFIFKGPAQFAPMGLNNLGRNNDQLVRLSHEPAGLLVVQHCHDIQSPVRETLRALAVQPGRSRRYCCIDGRDSLRILLAYGLYDEARQLSKRA